MMSPLKLFSLTLVAASALAVAPYFTGKIVSNQPAAGDIAATADAKLDTATSMMELPVPTHGAPIEALGSKLTKAPETKTSAKKSGEAAKELPKPDSKAKTEVAKKADETPAPAKPTATPKVELPYRPEVAHAQELMRKLGGFQGKADGKLGPITQAAIADYQKKTKVGSKGEPDADTIAALEKAATEHDLAEAAKKKQAEDAAAAQAKAAAAEDSKPAAKAEEPAATKTDDKKVDEKKTVAKADDPQFLILRKAEPAAATKPQDIGPVPRMTKVAEVKQLQEKLTAAKVYSANVDGKWGHLTIVAMKEFQQKYGLEVTGKPNKETWQKMNEVASGDWVVVNKDAEKPKGDAPVAKAEEPAIKVTDVKKSDRAKAKSTEPLTITVSRAAVASSKENAAASKQTDLPARKADTATAELKVSSPAADKSSDAPAPAVAQESKPAEQKSTPDAAASASEPPSLSGAPPANPDSPALAGKEVVVKLNADAAPASKANIPTPAVVSTTATAPEEAPIAKVENPEAAKPVAPAPAAPTESGAATGGLKVRAPHKPALAGATEAKPAATQTDESELPPAASKAAAAKVDKDLVETQARVAILASDPKYQLEKSAPAKVEGVTKLVEQAKTDASAKNTGAARESLKQAAAELEKTKQDSLKQKAEQKVAEVDAVYKQVKERFGSQLNKKDAKGDAANLADLMGKIDAGYTAMQADLKKGNYAPIVERCDGFKLQIEMLGNDAAKSYVDTTLEKVRRKLPKETVTQIDDLREQNKFMEAATVLDSAAKSKSTSSKGKS